jgi:hypothetical protein
LGPKFEAIAGQMRLTNDTITDTSKWIAKQRDEAAKAQRIAGIRNDFASTRAAISILATVATLAGMPPDVRRTVEAASILVNLAEACALHAATGGSSLILLNGGVSSFAALTSLMQDSPGDPTLAFLREIDQKLDSIRQEMRRSFALVNEKLDGVFETAFKTYREVLEIGRNVDDIRISLANMSQNLWAMEERLSSEIRAYSDEQTFARRTNCFRARTSISDDLYASCMSDLFTYATVHTLNALTVDDRDYSPSETARALSKGTPTELRYLARMLQSEFPAEDLAPPFEVLRIANPVEWAARANDYIEFVSRWAARLRTERDKQDVLASLGTIKQIGTDLQRALDSLGGVRQQPDGSVRRDAEHIVDVLSRHYQKKLHAFLDEFARLTTTFIERKVRDEIFEAPVLFTPGVVPAQMAQIPICSDFGWTYHVPPGQPFDSGVDKGARDQLPFSIDLDRIPKWLLNRGGTNAQGLPLIKSMSICIWSLQETTNRLTCFGGTFSGGTMAPGVATIRVTLELVKATFNLIVEHPTEYENVYFYSERQFSGGERCPPGTGMQWNSRLKNNFNNVWLTAESELIKEGLENFVRNRIIASLYQSRQEISGAWLRAFQEVYRAETSLSRAVKELDGARSLLDAYISVVFPDAYVSNDLQLLLAGSVNTRLPDQLVIEATLQCISVPTEQACGSPDMKALVSDVIKRGWDVALSV